MDCDCDRGSENRVEPAFGAERKQLLDELARESVEVAPRIFRTPGVCGGDACIRHTRIPVWLLEEGRRNGASDAQLLELHPDLTRADLEAAWAYVDQRPAEIETSLADNALI
jgi:uncharacterized protein (DUF433 family)